MKRIAVIAVMVVLVVVVAVAFARDMSKMELKAGTEIFACNCGEKCPCNTMSNNAGNCTCGKPMVKAKVNKVEGGNAMLSAAGWEKERPFAMTGKFMCNCGDSCKCGTISQQAGKCTCGKEMKKVI